MLVLLAGCLGNANISTQGLIVVQMPLRICVAFLCTGVRRGTSRWRLMQMKQCKNSRQWKTCLWDSSKNCCWCAVSACSDCLLVQHRSSCIWWTLVPAAHLRQSASFYKWKHWQQFLCQQEASQCFYLGSRSLVRRCWWCLSSGWRRTEMKQLHRGNRNAALKFPASSILQSLIHTHRPACNFIRKVSAMVNYCFIYVSSTPAAC